MRTYCAERQNGRWHLLEFEESEATNDITEMIPEDRRTVSMETTVMDEESWIDANWAWLQDITVNCSELSELYQAFRGAEA